MYIAFFSIRLYYHRTAFRNSDTRLTYIRPLLKVLDLVNKVLILYSQDQSRILQCKFSRSLLGQGDLNIISYTCYLFYQNNMQLTENDSGAEGIDVTID
jgi:uncharacterized membrane protein